MSPEAEPEPADPPSPSTAAKLRGRADAAVETAVDRWNRSSRRWPWLALPAEFVKRWTTANASILAGHLAYRVFVFILPLVVLLVGVLGYVSASDASLLSSSGGLKFGSAIASTMTTTGEQARDGRLQLVVFGGFAVLLAASGLVKALQLVFATAWGVSVKTGKSRWAVLGRFLPGVLVLLTAVALRQWVGRSGVVLTIGTELMNIAVDAVMLLGLSWVLPRRTSRVLDLVPGAVLGGLGLAGLHIAALIYFPSKIERASALYGTLGIALVALLYLFLVGQVLVASAIANAVWVDRAQIMRPPPPDPIDATSRLRSTVPRWPERRAARERDTMPRGQPLMTDQSRRIDELVARLTLDQKASLTAGHGLWSTVAIEEAGIPAVRVTDGPNGARGASVPGSAGATAVCVPCGAALGATWDPELIERVGELLGREARSKECRVLLAPTVNLHRSPLAGRNFECYSEDPLLSGRIAAAFIRGVQSRDVATTVKHFVGNEAEFERMTISSVIDERTLREIYLRPFEIAVREGGSLGVMTSYNRVNGDYCTDHADLLADILRGEWGFEGFVITDWFAATDTVRSSTAGTDLEMPGPARAFGARLAERVRGGELDESVVDAQVRRLLTVFARVGALDDPAPGPERSEDLPEDRALAREAATSAMVLLRNDGLLPLDLDAITSVAVVGPNADRAQIMGGGSASLSVHYRVTPLDAIRARLGADVSVTHERGCVIDRTVPPLGGASVTRSDGTAGLDVEFFAGTDAAGEAVHRGQLSSSRILLLGPPPEVGSDAFALVATGRFTPDDTGPHTFTLVQAGRARLFVDGQIVIDGVEDPPGRGSDFFGFGSEEVEAIVELKAGRPVDVRIEYSSASSVGVHGVKVGCRAPIASDLLERAVRAAADSDVAVVVVGTNDDWESEGHDRTDLALPGDQDELVRRVVAANPNTVVVLNTGAPVTVDWADEARAVLQIWFGGQEMAHALVDVLAGDADPGGRLPTTYPIALEDNPSHGNFPGADGEVRYEEGVFVGYRWYDSREVPVRFPFGHGLSYTTFEVEVVDAPVEHHPSGVTDVELRVTNTGDRAGSEVVQCYVAPAPGPVDRPRKELQAFAKVSLEPGESTTTTLRLDDRSFAHWDVATHDWRVERGRYELHIGRSVAVIDHVVPLTIAG